MRDITGNIPVYVSCPSSLTLAQESVVDLLRRLSLDHGLEWRVLGRTDYPVASPIETVLACIRKCYGGLILGFEYSHAEAIVVRRGQASERVLPSEVAASPWGQIEAAVLLARSLPILIFKEHGITGGIFDVGSGTTFFEMPQSSKVDKRLTEVVSQWAREVQEHYDKANSIFDVFLSFSGEDESAARGVFEFLAARGLRAFFSRQSIPQLGQADYMKAINTALDRARHMIVLSSSADGFAKPWVEREWTMFLNEKLSGRKGGNIVVVTAGTVAVAEGL